jgi:hypothetical protein
MYDVNNLNIDELGRNGKINQVLHDNKYLFDKKFQPASWILMILHPSSQFWALTDLDRLRVQGNGTAGHETGPEPNRR